MKAINHTLLFVLALSAATVANAGSMLRISCEGDAADAKVFVNGKFKGECPIDLQVPAGEVKLRATKSLSSRFDKVWEREISVGDGVVKKLEVNLDATDYSEGARQEILKSSGSVRKKAAAGDTAAMIALAEIYDLGIGVPKSYDTGMDWLRKAANAGDANALELIGRRYLNGKGVAKSVENAIEWFRKAVDAGDASAMLEMGMLYNEGKEVPKDIDKAVYWYKKAADAGELNAPVLLKSLGR